MRPIIAEKSYSSNCCFCLSIFESKISIYPDVVEVNEHYRMCGFRDKSHCKRILTSDIKSAEISSGKDPKFAVLLMIMALLAIGIGIIIDNEVLGIYIYSIAGTVFLGSFSTAVYFCWGGKTTLLTLKTTGCKEYASLNLVQTDAIVIYDVLFPLGKSMV